MFLLTFQVQCTAIRCIQKNIRCFLVVNNWPWWRLYTKVTKHLRLTKLLARSLFKQDFLGYHVTIIDDGRGGVAPVNCLVSNASSTSSYKTRALFL